MAFKYNIVEWQDTSGRIHEGQPSGADLERSKAVKVQFTNERDSEDQRFYIVRHPLTFDTLKRVIFDIKMTAKRYLIELVHD